VSHPAPDRAPSAAPPAADAPHRRTFRQWMVWPGGLIAMIVAIVIVDVTMLTIATGDKTFALAEVDGDPSAAWNRHREQQRRNDELGWQPAESFTSGLEATVVWYLENQTWWQQVLDGSYRLERRGL